MNKKELIDRLCLETGYRKAVVELVVEKLFSCVSRHLATGGKVQISSFGTFKAVKRAPRIGRNPHTGESVPIPERTVPVFEPSSSLKQQVI